MKRDINLIREILLRLDREPLFDGTRWMTPEAPSDLVSGDHSMGELSYHLQLLIEAGFLEGNSEAGYESPIINKLTWRGHEFLDNIRDDNIWRRTKERLKDLPSASMSVVDEIAKAEVKKKLGFN